ncbi:MAG: 2-succinyl-5-enolpyruvyl-6-hydroxy-3-cyclohexene-1-carboxylic-acid synthase [Cytophagaceae bacterium]
MSNNPFQIIYDLPEYLYQLGCRHVVLSPGSRCAPLSLAFFRYGKYQIDVVSDERSAAFIGLGIALNKKAPTILICTSGSALYNYAPAVVEAFYQEIPLLIFSADRPPEWIDQQDGQTIHQENIFGPHVRKSYNLSPDYHLAQNQDTLVSIIKESYQIATASPNGPVHLNFPFREPLYPTEETKISSGIQIQLEKQSLPTFDISSYKAKVKSYSKILFVVGQQEDLKLQELISQLHVPIISDSIGNARNCDHSIYLHDAILFASKENELKELQPDLIISIGKSVLSKPLKEFLRKSKASHWHIGKHVNPADPFQLSKETILCDEADFISQLEVSSNKEFLSLWLKLQSSFEKKTNDYFNSPTSYHDFSALNACLKHIPKNSTLHLANSMSVRFVNYFNTKDLLIQSNRGVSGIDGVVSTAVGYSSVDSNFNTVIIGDQAFFYDRNSFWNKVDTAQLRIIVINNGGGAIFGMIDGPSKQKELIEAFIAPHDNEANFWCEENEVEYHRCADFESLNKALSNFYTPSKKAKLIEVITPFDESIKEFKSFKAILKS